MTETEACIALNMVPNMGPMRLRKLLEVFETPQRILLAKAGELRAAEGIGGELANTIAGWEKQIDLESELKRIAEFGARVITQASPEYPHDLREIYNPPILLYVWGTLDERDHARSASVRARPATTASNAPSAFHQLPTPGHVVSGLARASTPRRTRRAGGGGRTIAVIGSGLDLYPPENLGLAERSRRPAPWFRIPMTFRPIVRRFPTETASSPAGAPGCSSSRPARRAAR